LENNVVLVSSPDSYPGGDERILLAGVSNAQTIEIIRFYTELDQLTVIHSITDDNYHWISNTAQGCDLIIVDVDNLQNFTAGYLLAQRKCFWYGTSSQVAYFNAHRIQDPMIFIAQTRGHFEKSIEA
jgi:hypothetical protein